MGNWNVAQHQVLCSSSIPHDFCHPGTKPEVTVLAGLMDCGHCATLPDGRILMECTEPICSNVDGAMINRRLLLNTEGPLQISSDGAQCWPFLPLIRKIVNLLPSLRRRRQERYYNTTGNSFLKTLFSLNSMV